MREGQRKLDLVGNGIGVASSLHWSGDGGRASSKSCPGDSDRTHVVPGVFVAVVTSRSPQSSSCELTSQSRAAAGSFAKAAKSDPEEKVFRHEHAPPSSASSTTLQFMVSPTTSSGRFDLFHCHAEFRLISPEIHVYYAMIHFYALARSVRRKSKVQEMRRAYFTLQSPLVWCPAPGATVWWSQNPLLPIVVVTGFAQKSFNFATSRNVWFAFLGRFLPKATQLQLLPLV